MAISHGAVDGEGGEGNSAATGVALIEREGCIAARFKANVACKSAFRIGDVVIESSCLVLPAFPLNPDVTSLSMSLFHVHPTLNRALLPRTRAYGKKIHPASYFYKRM